MWVNPTSQHVTEAEANITSTTTSKEDTATIDSTNIVMNPFLLLTTDRDIKIITNSMKVIRHIMTILQIIIIRVVVIIPFRFPPFFPQAIDTITTA
ncbi:hypothetical protein Tco_1388381, partial [Tanacetum coccineum]